MNTSPLVTAKTAPTCAPGESRTDTTAAAPPVTLSPEADALVALARSKGWKSLRDMPRTWHVPADPRVGALDYAVRAMRDIVQATLPLTNEIERLKADLAAAKPIAPVTPDLDLKQQIADLRAGLEQIRTTLNEVYPKTDMLTLDKRIVGLAKERDMWRRRAEQAETTNRLAVQDAVREAQRVPAVK